MIKGLIVEPAQLKYFWVNKSAVVQIDASTDSLRAVLLQEKQPACYESRNLTDSEINYAPIKLELLATVYGMQKFDQYIFVNPDVIVHTDHCPRESIFNKPLNKAPKTFTAHVLDSSKISYQSTVVYEPGKEPVLAGMLSRAPVDQVNTGIHEKQIFPVNQLWSFMSDLSSENLKSDLSVSEQIYQLIKQHTKDDPALSKLQSMIMFEWPLKLTEVSEFLKQCCSHRDELAVLDCRGSSTKNHR